MTTASRWFNKILFSIIYFFLVGWCAIGCTVLSIMDNEPNVQQDIGMSILALLLLWKFHKFMFEIWFTNKHYR